MKKLIPAIALLAFALAGARSASAQDPADEDIKLLRKDSQSVRKQFIAANMVLSDKEAEQFWPTFERYTQALVAKQGDIRGRASVDQAILEVCLKYFPFFRKVSSGKSTALFFQLGWRLGLLVDLQLASQTPVIEP